MQRHKPMPAGKPMARSTKPMRRRKDAPSREREQKPTAEWVAPTVKPLVHGVYAGTTKAAAPKRHYVRSPALLAAVRTLPCQVTGKVGETEAAHSNWPQHGKAGRIKADDNRVAAMCRDIHRELDQGRKWSAEERQNIWWDAHCKTVRELIARGLWPARVPVPQLEDFWA
jgi:hypothetical protein